MIIRAAFLVSLFFCSFQGTLAADPIDRLIRSADARFEKGEYALAVPLYLLAVEKGARNEHVCRRLGYSYYQVGDFIQSEVWYAELMKYLGPEDADVHAYAEALKRNGKYAEYEHWLGQLIQSGSYEMVTSYRAELEQQRTLRSNASQFEIAPVGINTVYDECAPAWLSNERILFSSSRTVVTTIPGKTTRNWDIQLAERKLNGDLLDARPLAGGVNSVADERSAIWGRTKLDLIVERAVTPLGGKPSRGLFKAEHQGSEMWEMAGPFFVDTGYVAYEPALSSNGQTLIFVSDSEGGVGGSDLYVSTKRGAGWSVPVSLGNGINTPGNERTPFIDGNDVLYYSSDSDPGLGGFDVYMAKPMSEGGYVIPLNIGSPINSGGDDLGFIMDPTGKGGYFSSNRPGGKGGDDIYRIMVHGAITDIPYHCAGLVIDEETQLPRSGVLVQALNDRDEEVACDVSDMTGQYTLRIDPDSSIRILASMSGYTVTEQWLGPADIGSNRAIVRDIHLLPWSRTWLRGVVRRSDNGAMAEGVELTFMDMANFSEYRTITDAAGEFRIRSPLNSSYEVKLSLPGYYNYVYAMNSGFTPGVVELDGGNPIVIDRILLNEPIALPHALEAGTTEQLLELNELADRLADNAALRVGIAVNKTFLTKGGIQDPTIIAEQVILALESRGVPKGRLQPVVVEDPQWVAPVAYVVRSM